MACALKPEDKEKVLAVLDSYHDFCKGERTTKSARDSNSEDDEGDPRRIAVMRDYLPKLLQNLYGASIGNSYQENIKNITCQKVSSVSAIEHSGVTFFEEDPVFRDVLSANPEAREVLTFQEIIDAYATPVTKEALINKYKNGLQYRVLELSKSGRRFGKDPARATTETKEIEILSDFLLNFFFFTSEPPGGVHMSFDAGERIVGDIFRDRKNVKCCIFPETLADSATTSFGMLAGRTEFVYPSTQKVIEFTSNLFSKNKYKIYFEDKGYSDQNPYGFTMNIEHKTKPGVKLVLPFSPKQTEGPSVNYLIDLLKLAEENSGKAPAAKIKYATIEKKGTILNIGDALDKNDVFRAEFEAEAGAHTNGILPDLKRGGDHEAVNASKAARDLRYKNFIFCTIDILCALKARLEMINTIWQGKDKIILYRYPTVLPADVMKHKYAEKAKALYDLLCKLYTFIQTDIPTSLTTQLPKFTAGKLALVDYSDRDKSTPPVKGLCEEALNALLRIAMLDLEEYTNRLKEPAAAGASSPAFLGIAAPVKVKMIELAKEYETFYGKDLAASKALVTIVNEGGVNVAKYKGRNIQTDFDEVLTFYNGVVATVKKSLNLDITSSKETEATEDGAKFRKKVYEIVKVVTGKKGAAETFLLQEHPVFGFNPAAFEKLYEALIYIHDLTEKNKIRASRDYNKIMNKILSGDPTAPFDYFALVKDVVAQIHMETYRSAVQSILDFRSEAQFGGEGMTKDETEQARRDMLVGKGAPTADKNNRDNGVVLNVRNYYKELKDAGKFSTELSVIPYEVPKAVGKVKKGGQRGGAGGSPYQYYDLNDLLYKVASIAASFIESVYSEEFPEYVSLHELDIATAEFQKIRAYSDEIFQNMKAFLTSQMEKFDTLFRDVEKQASILAFSGKAQRLNAWDAQKGIVQTHLGATPLTKEKLLEAVTELKNGLAYFLQTNAANAVEYPSISEFLQRVFSDKYIIPDEENPASNDTMGDLTYRDIGELWQAGLYEIRQNKEYLYEYSQVDDLISYLLSLRLKTIMEENYGDNNNNNNNNNENEPGSLVVSTLENKDNLLTFFNSTTGQVVQTRPFPVKTILEGINKTILESSNVNISVGVTMIFVFTLIENIMNPTKKSFFLKNYRPITFENHRSWDTNLNTLLTGVLFPSLQEAVKPENNKTKLDMTPFVAIGGGKQHPKLTRKIRKSRLSRKSRKYRRTMKR
jgi:hypothetical protein